MDKIRTYFESITPISTTDWDIFASKLKKACYPKKTALLKKGTVENHLSFIDRGTVRLFIPKPENDLTFGFCFENQFISAYDSFLTRQPSTYSIETLSETVIWKMSYEDLQRIYKDTQCGNVIGRVAAEHQFLIKSKREQDLLNKSAEQRYINLFTERPQLLRELPLKYIASYIGVTPQALSRIRKRIS